MVVTGLQAYQAGKQPAKVSEEGTCAEACGTDSALPVCSRVQRHDNEILVSRHQHL